MNNQHLVCWNKETEGLFTRYLCVLTSETASSRNVISGSMVGVKRVIDPPTNQKKTDLYKTSQKEYVSKTHLLKHWSNRFKVILES